MSEDVSRFPAPWLINEHADYFIVRDASGQTLAHFYFDELPDRRTVDKRLNRDDARQMAINFAKLPDLLHVGSVLSRRPRQRL